MPGRVLSVVFLGLFLLAGCSRSAQYVVVVDSVYAAAHEAGWIDGTIERLHKESDGAVRGVVVPPEPTRAFVKKLPLSGATLILTPLLAPVAALFAELFPNARIVVMSEAGASVSIPGASTVVGFDRTAAMREAGKEIGTYAAGGRAEAGRARGHGGAAGGTAGRGPAVWGFFLADSRRARADLAAFRSGLDTELASAGEREPYRIISYDSAPDRDALRSAIQEAKSGGAEAYAFFVGRQNAYCLDLIAGTGAQAIVPGRMGTTAYEGQILCSVDQPLADVVRTVVSRGSGLPSAVEVPATLSCSEGKGGSR